jgi:hypothetical protein
MPREDIIMAVETYSVYINPTGGAIRIRLFGRGARLGGQLEANFEVPPARAPFLVDVLRNERPIYWHIRNEQLYTGREQIGEEES